MSNRMLLLIAVMFFTSLIYPVFAADTNGSSESPPAQKEEPSDFDDWYQPDDAYQTDDQRQTTENADKANGPDEGPFLAPGDDQRSKVR